MNELSDTQLSWLFAWSCVGMFIYAFTWEHINSRVKLPVWALICGPFVTVMTIIYWFTWSIHFMFFKKR